MTGRILRELSPHEIAKSERPTRSMRRDISLGAAFERVAPYAEPRQITVKSVSPMHEGMDDPAIRVDFSDGKVMLWEKSAGVLRVLRSNEWELATPHEKDMFRDAVNETATKDQRTKRFISDFPEMMR
ncbi:MAG: hypothetical protein Q7S22_07225 [Candidatus Micrarchaeota archaeon]|nr:hypothetical protein [Candidatus Micrarchaeota archaeon]